MVDDGHEDGGVRAFTDTCFKYRKIAKVFAIPAFSVVCDYERVVCIFGNDVDIVTDA